MKKTLLITVLALTTLGFEAFAKEVKPLPQIEPPRELVQADSEFAEGTITRLTATDVAVFLPWAQNAQSVLTKALADIESMPIDQQVRHLTTVMKSVVRRSGEKNYQLFTRFALNRGILLVSELLQEATYNENGILENALDIQVKAINVALQVHESDLAYQRRVAAGEAATDLEYANFGLKFGRAMLKAVDSVFDASAQYRLLYKTLEIVNWDLSRDARAADNADIIIDIYNTLSVMNEHPTQDDRSSILDIRRLQVLRALLNDASASVSDRISTGSDSDAGSIQDSTIGETIPNGATVYHGSSEYLVMGRDGDNRYGLKQTVYPYSVISGIARGSIAVKSGCSRFACVGKTGYYGTNEVNIVGITPSGAVTVKQTVYPYAVFAAVPAGKVGKTSGCFSSDSRNICVGATAVSGSQEVRIVALHPDGTVTVKQQVYPYAVTATIDPRGLAISSR